MHVRWEADAEVTAHGSLTYFIEFLKVSGLWEDWVRDCPLACTSPNAPLKEEILGTILLSVLAGHKRGQLTARIVALIFNWWSIFTRMATRNIHREALTRRPLFLFSLARKTRSGNQSFLTIQRMHAKAGKVAHLLAKISGWFKGFKTLAEQLALDQRWFVMLRWIFQHFTAERRAGLILRGPVWWGQLPFSG